MTRALHDGRDDGLQPLESLDLQNTQGFADLLQRMSKTAFGGRELGEAFEVLRAMADDPDCTRVLTISGAMSIAKMGLVVCQMIDAGLVQIVISTGAIMAHGLSEAIGCVHYKHDPKVSDKQLYDWGYNRVYDTLEMESNLWQAQQVVGQVAGGARLVAADLLVAVESRDRAEAVRARADAQHPRHGLPQGGAGVRAGLHRFGTGPGRGHALPGQEYSPGKQQGLEELCGSVPPYNPFLDLYDYAQRIQRAKRLGIFTIGGGVPRNWAQQVGPFHDIINMRLGSDVPRAAVPLRRADLSRAGALGRAERLHLYRRRLLGQVPQPGGRRPVRRGPLRRHHRLAAAGAGDPGGAGREVRVLGGNCGRSSLTQVKKLVSIFATRRVLP